MARIVITRPNGETEYAELTTDKAQAGNDCLTVEKAGTVYYAKLDNGVSTHMYVIKPDGRKLYVQKETSFKWKYELNGSVSKAQDMIIPRTGKYKLSYIVHVLYPENEADYNREEYDVFNKGPAFDAKRSLRSNTGKLYRLKYSSDNGLLEEDPNYKKLGNILEYIEYIGEA